MRRIRERRLRGEDKVVIGRPDVGLTGNSGLVAAVRVAAKLALTAALDAEIGEFKQRGRGRSAGELLVVVASCQLVGGDHVVLLDRLRDDGAGQQLMTVKTPAASTAAGLARRFTAEFLVSGDRGCEGEESVEQVAVASVRSSSGGGPDARWIRCQECPTCS